tara:strand:- start:321 stop:611 length:291 start_codon:yes stop_codon:yes gene_type:complete
MNKEINIPLTVDNNTALQVGQAYIVDDAPMVLRSIEGKRHSFTDGRYGFGRVLGNRPWHADQLANLEVAEGVNPQVILDSLKESVSYMADYYRSNK